MLNCRFQETRVGQSVTSYFYDRVLHCDDGRGSDTSISVEQTRPLDEGLQAGGHATQRSSPETHGPLRGAVQQQTAARRHAAVHRASAVEDHSATF